jgi:hypothetical protein
LILWRNRISHLIPNQEVVGSSPTRITSHGSSVGQSARLLTEWSGVQVPLVTKDLRYGRQSASEGGVDPAVSNYSPVATLLNDNTKLNTSVFGMLPV